MSQISARAMVEALYSWGMKDHEIAVETGISQPSVTRIRNGVQADPKYATWQSISELYLKKQAERAAALPQPPAGEGGNVAP